MSLFSDSKYQYRETYFVLFEKKNQPDPEAIEAAFAQLGPRYETVQTKMNDDGFESMTIRSPHDFSAMDITCVEGDEVVAQIKGIQDEFRTMTLSGDDMKKLMRLKEFDARFDIFHFEEVGDAGPGEDEFLDPGGLLLVLEKLADVCDGVSLDPQSQTLM